MPTSSSARSWLFSWGGNIPESAESAEIFASITDSAPELVGNEQAESMPAQNPTKSPQFSMSDGAVSDPESSAGPATNVKPPSSSADEDTNKLSVLQHSTATKPPRSAQTQGAASQDKTLKHKSSTASYSSYAASNWLGWNTKSSRSNSLPEDVSACGNSSTSRESTREPSSEAAAGDDASNGVQEVADDSQKNGDMTAKIQLQPAQSAGSDKERSDTNGSLVETTEQVANDSGSGAHSRTKSWGFWTSAEGTTGKKDLPAHSRITNTILRSTPAMSSWKDAETKPEPAKEAAPKSSPGQGSQEGVPKTDDAVLYKPHHSAKEFSRINTHKNENLKENVLVPDWQTCLRLQQHTGHASTSSHLHGGTGFSAAHAFDIRHWKWYLSSISSRFGLTLPTNHKARPHSGGSSSSTGDSESDSGGELRFSQEQTYQLYGKSLSRLPSHKRACLPNHSKYFTGPQQDSQATSTKRRKTQLGGDAEGENPVTITNDDARNLSINDSKPVGPKYAANILPRKFGPLRKISKILIIGVHGFFPTRMIRPLIGAPKGTSSKFANEAEKAVIRYLVENDMMGDNDNRDVSIQKIALEKEGKIFDRVEFFLQILTKWEDELNEADFVFIAAHSQGCVVSIILLARLIKMGILKHASYKRIGVLGMAGVNNGPFYGTDKSLFMKAYSAIEHESMIELFELTKFDSPQSLAYKDAMQTIVSTNVKICLVGSINDQLVPLYSALASHVYHPNIYRACYIDSSAKTPAFIKTLISICCQLQNMGYFDNNVIKEISSILAGPLTGGGHSKIYNDGKVYDLGVKFMLDTDDLVIPHQADSTEKPGAYDSHVDVPYTNRVFVREYNVGKIGTNPFILPWCLRGLIFNIQKNWGAGESQRTAHGKGHKTAMEEVSELYTSFDEWRPETKPLKDLKFRLSGIRASKL